MKATPITTHPRWVSELQFWFFSQFLKVLSIKPVLIEFKCMRLWWQTENLGCGDYGYGYSKAEKICPLVGNRLLKSCLNSLLELACVYQISLHHNLFDPSSWQHTDTIWSNDHAYLIHPGSRPGCVLCTMVTYGHPHQITHPHMSQSSENREEKGNLSFSWNGFHRDLAAWPSQTNL